VGEGLLPLDGSLPGKTVVYAHTADRLFRVDPQTLVVSLLGKFLWPKEPHKMTDIALDRDGKMIGVSQSAVFQVDPMTAACTHLADQADHFVGLSYVVDGTDEFLMGIAKEGQVYRLDPTTGQSTVIGDLGNGLRASGDIVSAHGLGTLATVEHPAGGTDWLARLDPKTGKATLIGETGFSAIFGLGFWGKNVFGFSASHEFVLIDVVAGQGTLQHKGDESWWGAGVTTLAPVID
jgi:hypothetical protein